jgi:hypothetical protein
MAVDFADEHSAVLVANPGRNGHEIDSRHDALGNEVVARIVETNSSNTSVVASEPEAFPEGFGWYVLLASLGRGKQPLRVWVATVGQFPKQILQGRVEVDDPVFMVFSQAIRSDCHLAAR